VHASQLAFHVDDRDSLGWAHIFVGMQIREGVHSLKARWNILGPQ
jgi:hypothetical protein